VKNSLTEKSAMDKSIKEKIQKLIAMGERGGTEAEMMVAMQKVQELLVKHGLSMTDVSEVEKEEAAVDYSEGLAARSVWQQVLAYGVANLYFCTCFKSGGRQRRMIFVGKPSNVMIVKQICSYLIALGDRLAKETGQDVHFKNSFKQGYGSRISQRCFAEIRNAKEGKLTDTSTGTALVVAPLYDRAKQENQLALRSKGINLRSSYSWNTVRDGNGYAAGVSAGNSVGLRPTKNAIGH
jgi:hypothetical protein